MLVCFLLSSRQYCVQSLILDWVAEKPPKESAAPKRTNTNKKGKQEKQGTKRKAGPAG